MLQLKPSSSHPSIRCRRWPASRGWAPRPVLVQACFDILPGSSSSRRNSVQLKNALANFLWELPAEWAEPGSTLVVKALQRDWHDPTAELLASVFAEAAGFQSYKKLLKRNIKSYLDSQVNLIPQAVIFTAVLRTPTTDISLQPAPDQGTYYDGTAPTIHLDVGATPGQAAGDAATQSEGADTGQQGSVPGPSEVLLGTVEVSFDRSTHSTYLLLNPPRKAGYLCNMAVAPEWRRKGIGMLLIKAVEEACAIAGETELYLHFRIKDAPAAALYNAAGFTEVAADWGVVKLWGQEPKRLMKKQLKK